MTPWTIDNTALSGVGVSMSTSGNVGSFTWGAAPNTTTVDVEVQSGVANFFPERSGKHVLLMTLLGLLNQ